MRKIEIRLQTVFFVVYLLVSWFTNFPLEIYLLHMFCTMLSLSDIPFKLFVKYQEKRRRKYEEDE